MRQRVTAHITMLSYGMPSDMLEEHSVEAFAQESIKNQGRNSCGVMTSLRAEEEGEGDVVDEYFSSKEKASKFDLG